MSGNAVKKLWLMTRAEFRMMNTKPKYDAIVKTLRAGQPVFLSTYARTTKIAKPEHIRLTKGREIQIPQGRKWVTLVEEQVDQLAYQAGVKPIPIEKKVFHAAVIEKALYEGKPVPASVLKDYPYLAKTGKKGSVKGTRAPKNPCPRPSRQNVSRRAITRAARLSQRFHGFRPRGLTGVNVTWPKALVLLGHVVRLDYLSDKEDGKIRCYTHDFKQPVSVFASGSAKTGRKNILLLQGNFSITQEGIVG